MSRVIAGVLLVFALLFTSAATSVAQPIGPGSPPPDAPTLVQENVTENELQAFFSRKVKNVAISNVSLSVYTERGCRGGSYSVRPGTTTSSKYRSFYIPAGHFGTWGTLPVVGGLFGACFNISTVVPMPYATPVYIWRPW